MTLTIGLGMPQLGPHVDAGVVRRFCTRAEELGYASLWVQEHLFYPHANTSGYAGRTDTTVHPAYRSVFGPFELMAFAAALTERITIGSSILVAGYHRPIELAQRLSTLDQLSQGRIVAGLAAGWSDEEHVQMDVDPRSRGRRMDELVLALKACWGPDPVSFEGEFFSIPTSDVRPKPVQKPHPPLLSGLRSAAGMQRTAAMFDIWNPSRGTAEELRGHMATLAEARPAAADPVALYFRAYAQRPTDPVGSGGAGLEGLHADLRTAQEAGAEQLIIDCNFWDGIDSPAAWDAVPDLMAPFLEEASAGVPV